MEKRKVDEPVPGFQIEESGAFHFLNARNMLAKRNSSVSNENKTMPRQNLVYF